MFPNNNHERRCPLFTLKTISGVGYLFKERIREQHLGNRPSELASLRERGYVVKIGGPNKYTPFGVPLTQPKRATLTKNKKGETPSLWEEDHHDSQQIHCLSGKGFQRSGCGKRSDPYSPLRNQWEKGTRSLRSPRQGIAQVTERRCKTGPSDPPPKV